MKQYAKIENNQIVATVNLADITKTISLPATNREAALNSHGYYSIQHTQAPAYDPIYQELQKGELTLVNGVPTYLYSVVDLDIPLIPSVAAYKLKIELENRGYLDTLETIVSQQTKQLQLAWNGADKFSRQSPTILQFEALNLSMPDSTTLTSTVIDDIFLTARNILV